MAKPPDSTRSKYERAERAVRLAEMGDLEGAEAALLEAIELDPRNLDLYFNLALVEERLGDVDRAAEFLTTILDRKPTYAAAAARLSRLLARYEIEDLAVLIPSGLRAALNTPGIAHQPIVDATFDWLIEFDPNLEDGIARIEGGRTGEREMGREFVVPKTSDSLTAGLLQRCLASGILKDASAERLLTGIRAALLLDCPPSRFEDRGLTDFALSLIVQGWNNDQSWAVTREELSALDALTIDRAALLGGDRSATWDFIRLALYRPLDQILTPALDATEARRLKPRSVRELIEPQLQVAARQREAAARIPALKPLADATSLQVAGQYEAAPYPRWQSLHISQPGSLVRAIREQFAGRDLTRLDQPFDVLIAGCGTGQQALQSAAGYGPNARLLAMDLSRTSLGYASDMAGRNNIANVTFMQGDILDVGALERTFDIIECVGVLHHMADWRAGWKALLGRLSAGGLMYVGLYSAVSRRNLAALRDEAVYPGPGCSDEAARAYRRDLLLRDETTPGGELKISRDFYALHAFRDLVLHESEAHVTLGEIAVFLDENGLVFGGFTLEHEILADFLRTFPGSGTPGSIADWVAYEAANPSTFDGMYRFWVGRRN